MPVHVSSYEGGIDRDSSKNKYPKGSYYKMKNFRLISFEELSNGAVTSIKGNKSITITGSTNSDDIIIGQHVIRNYLVVWSTNCHDNTGGRGTIWRTDLSIASPVWTKIYENASMMLTTKHPIAEESIGYYESDLIVKVYWTDNFNMIRFINILSTGPSSVDQLDILPSVSLEAPVVKNIGGGNLYVGKIQYAFQYYNIGGIETVFSPCTPLIHLTQSSEGLTGSNIRLYEGSEALDSNGNPNNSGKSVTIEINDADTNYDMVRVVAILYRNLDQVPDIHIVGEYEVSDGLIVSDYGVYTKGTLTLNAFRTLGNGELYCKTISQKGNKALIANITEKYFDIDDTLGYYWDARAYRARNNAAVALFKVYNGISEDTIVKSGSYPNATYKIGGVNVDEEHDCICPYNYDFLNNEIDEVATYTDADTNAYKYQSDLITLGGEGINIKYEFLYPEMFFEESTDARYNQPDTTTIENLTSFDSHKNPLRAISLMNYKHDEVYRHAIVFTNAKGQDSFAKWISDIKTPTVLESPLCAVSGGTTSIAHPLGIKFTVNTTGLLAYGIVGMRIVRVERKKEDRSILSQGIISHMFLDNSADGNDIYDQLIVGYPRPVIKTPTEGVDAKFIKQTTVIQFISPEINYFKDLSTTSTDYIKIASRLTERRTYMCAVNPDESTVSFDDWGINERTHALGGSTFPLSYDVVSWINVSKYLSTNITGLTNLYTYNILEGTIAGIVEYGGEEQNLISLTTSPGGKNILNRSIDFGSLTSLPDHEGPSGTCAILIVTPGIDNSFLISTDELELYLVDYKRPGIAASQYGGLTYESRQSNIYIECGPYTEITTGTQDMNVYGGDCVIDFHEHLRTMWEVDDNDGDNVADVSLGNRFLSIVMFPCETYINLGLTNGYKYSRNYNNAYINALREEVGTWNGDYIDHTMPNDDYDLIQDKNMYEYNSVYSQQNTTKVYFTKPLNWLAIVHDDTTVRISLEKVAREETDSFIKFLTDNKKTLPTQFGPINDLFLFKNYMIVFFDHAFGSLSIDERAILPIQNNSILELGAGNNLQFFDFISDSSGSIHPSSINKIGNGFGWYDAYLNSFGYYNGETQDIGLTKGISSTIKTYTDLIKDIRSVPVYPYYNNQLYGGNFITVENKKYKESYCAMIVSELSVCASKTGSSVTFTLACSPGVYNDIEVVINGVEYYADTTCVLGVGTLVINTTDNPTLNLALYTAGLYYYIYYKDLSKVFSFNSVLGIFQHEIDLFPQWLIGYNDDLYEIFYKMVIYQENEGYYGRFYGIYRYGEIEYIINPQKSLVCIFNNHEYAMEAINNIGANVEGETWDSLRTYNDYQYSVGLHIACTYSSTTSKFTDVSHGLILNTEITLSGATIPTGLSLSTKYYVVSVETDAFKLSDTKGGTPLTLTNSSSCYYNLCDATLTVGTNVKRRMRSWRIKDLRDRSINKPRMRDSYIRMLFKYLHGANKRIVMHDLYTYYTVTRESLNQ